MARFEPGKYKFLDISYIVCLSAQRVSALTTTILPTTAGTYQGLNWFGHGIKGMQINTYQNIAKLLTHSSNLVFP